MYVIIWTKLLFSGTNSLFFHGGIFIWEISVGYQPRNNTNTNILRNSVFLFKDLFKGHASQISEGWK